MSLVASIKNGEVVESASQSSLSKANSSSNGMDKEAFLQLLVAQMQYQDPLEPTSNTEYISQYAQFSQVESITNMSESMDLMRASSLVGQEVYIKTSDSTGNTGYIKGKVDYVVYENNKAYLSINENLYSIDDLDTVVDSEYADAYDAAYELTVAINKLPGVSNISISGDGQTIDNLYKTYSEMSDYGKGFVASDTVSTLNSYVERLAALRAAAGVEAE